MIGEIFNDIRKGLIDSLQMGIIIDVMKKNKKIANILRKTIKYNILLFSLITIVNYYLPFYGIIIIAFAKIHNFFFQLVQELDLLNAITSEKAKKNDTTMIYSLSWAIISSCYRLIFCVIAEIIKILLDKRFYWLAVVINLFILSIYHSIYSFDNFFVFKKIDIPNRIPIFERLWPYFLGFGLTVTIIYLSGGYHMYNIYLMIMNIIPFYLSDHNTESKKYPPINISIFTFITSLLIKIPINIMKLSEHPTF